MINSPYTYAWISFFLFTFFLTRRCRPLVFSYTDLYRQDIEKRLLDLSKEHERIQSEKERLETKERRFEMDFAAYEEKEQKHRIRLGEDMDHHHQAQLKRLDDLYERRRTQLLHTWTKRSRVSFYDLWKKALYADTSQDLHKRLIR